MLKLIEQSQAHLAELLPTNGDDGSGRCGGKYHDDRDADGTSGDDRRCPAAVGGGHRVEDQAVAVEEMLVAETASAMVEAASMMMVVTEVTTPPRSSRERSQKLAAYGRGFVWLSAAPLGSQQPILVEQLGFVWLTHFTCPHPSLNVAGWPCPWLEPLRHTKASTRYPYRLPRRQLQLWRL